MNHLSGRLPHVDPTHFAMVPRNDVPRSSFDIRHTHKTTFDQGALVPIFVEEILPGDSMRVKMNCFARLATPYRPFMDNLVLESFFFFVPNRLVWDNWQRFMGEKASPSDTTSFLVPQCELTAAMVLPNTVADYFGVTMDPASLATMTVNALPFRGYNLIYNEWFRDQDLQTPQTVSTTDGPDSGITYTLMNRGKRHDYFTSARPWPEKPSKSSGMSGDMDPRAYGQGFLMFPGGTSPMAAAPVSGFTAQPGATTVAGGVAGSLDSGNRLVTTNANVYNPNSGMRVNAIGVNSAPDVKVFVNDLRRAAMIQTFMERNARGGTRYTEILRSHFGVTSPDGRLQRPEFLGGGRSFVNVSPVAQQAPGAGPSTVLGELGAVGTVMGTEHGFSGSFTEHGYVIGLINVRSDLTYQQGVRRMWWRRSPYDFYWPAFAHLGEQAIMRQEIYANGVEDSANDQAVFGYQERWAEYKYHPSRTSGHMRSTVSAPLDVWHLGQEFVGAPGLNSAFITDLAPMSRVVQTTTIAGQQFIFDSVFEQRMVRPMPMFSIPGFGARL